MKRVFINQTGDSNKYWIINQEDKTFSVSWGKIGSSERMIEKQFSDSDECSKEVNKLINEKLKKGYKEIEDIEHITNKQAAEYKPMDEEVFWEIISTFNWNKTGNDDAVLRPALKRLMSMTVDDIKQFAEILAEKLYHLDGIEYASNIGPDSYQGDENHFSVDYFLYVRCCVVANGKDFYYYVLNNPIAMPKELDFEPLLYLADEAYNKKLKTTGESISTKFSFETFSNTNAWKK